MLPAKKLKELKEELDSCKNPLFIYDKDGDGLCAFLLLYKYKKEGVGIVRVERMVDVNMLKRVQEIQPDKIFLLDIPTMGISQEFVDEVKVPVIQVDHHLGDAEVTGMKVFNPRDYDKDDSSPTTTICYNVVKENLWLAAVGTTFDWHVTKETKEFGKEHPELIDPKIKDPAKARFESEIGRLCTIINFILKGKTDSVKKHIAEMMKINDPTEILEQKTEAGKAIYKRYEEVNKQYQEILAHAEQEMKKQKGKLFVYRYPSLGDATFTSDISNNLIYKYPKKIIIIAREKDGEMKCSLRSASVEIRTKLLKALEGLDGYGGGHDLACGAGIKKHDFDRFLEQFRELI